jgi:hypothetical protein
LEHHERIIFTPYHSRKAPYFRRGSFYRFGAHVAENERVLKSELERRMISEKEDAFFRLFASLIVQTVLEKHRLDR